MFRRFSGLSSPAYKKVFVGPSVHGGAIVPVVIAELVEEQWELVASDQKVVTAEGYNPEEAVFGFKEVRGGFQLDLGGGKKLSVAKESVNVVSVDNEVVQFIDALTVFKVGYRSVDVMLWGYLGKRPNGKFVVLAVDPGKCPLLIVDSVVSAEGLAYAPDWADPTSSSPKWQGCPRGGMTPETLAVMSFDELSRFWDSCTPAPWLDEITDYGVEGEFLRLVQSTIIDRCIELGLDPRTEHVDPRIKEKERRADYGPKKMKKGEVGLGDPEELEEESTPIGPKDAAGIGGPSEVWKGGLKLQGARSLFDNPALVEAFITKEKKQGLFDEVVELAVFKEPESGLFAGDRATEYTEDAERGVFGIFKRGRRGD